MQNLLNKLSRNGLQTYLLLFITYSFLIIFYDPPLGLMDDFKNLEHIQSLNDNFITYYLEYNSERIFEKGLFQPLYLIQMYFQYSISNPLFVYLQNLLIVFTIHYIFIKGLNIFIEINQSVALIIFLIFPFTNDLFIHPSLQEKYSFLLVGIVLPLIVKDRKFRYLIFILSFLIPLIKLQGTIFLFLFIAVHILIKNRNSFFALVGNFLGIMIQVYVTFFIEAEYKIRSNFDNLISNLKHPINILFLILIFIYIANVYFSKDFNLIKVSIIFSSSAILFIYINFYVLGYLLSTYAYFISVIITTLLLENTHKLNIKQHQSIAILLFFLIISISQYFVPRFERWSDLNELYTTLEQDTYGEIYYCSEEASIFLNKTIKNENTINFVNQIRDIEDKNDFLILLDDFQCNGFSNEVSSDCVAQTIFTAPYQKLLINQVKCKT